MPSPRRALLVLPLIAALALTACDDGPTTTQARDVADFTRIDNRDSVDVRLRVGEPQRVRVRAGEKVIDDVRTEVRDGTLEIAFDRDGFGGSDVEVEVSVPELTAIEASGSGDIEASGVDADAFEISSDGSADIVVAGAAARLTVDLDGSGEADLADLAADSAQVTVGRLRRARPARRRAARRRGRRLRRRPIPRRPDGHSARRRLRRAQPRGLSLPLCRGGRVVAPAVSLRRRTSTAAG